MNKISKWMQKHKSNICDCISGKIKPFYKFEREILSDNTYEISALYEEYSNSINTVDGILAFRGKLKQWIEANRNSEDLNFLIKILATKVNAVSNFYNVVVLPGVVVFVSLIFAALLEDIANDTLGIPLYIFTICIGEFIYLVSLANDFHDYSVKKDFYELLYKELTSKEP